MALPPDFPQDLHGPEASRQRAMIAADVAVLSSVLHDNLIYIHSNGMFDTKASHLTGIAGGVVKYAAMAISDAKYVALGTTGWLVSGRLQATAIVAAKVIPIDAAFTAVWLMGLVWQMVSWQSTPWPRPEE